MGANGIIPGGNPYKTTAPLASTKDFVGREGTSAPYLDMRVEFRNGGSLLEVAAPHPPLVTGGTISNLTKVADGNYFRLTPYWSSRLGMRLRFGKQGFGWWNRASGV